MLFAKDVFYRITFAKEFLEAFENYIHFFMLKKPKSVVFLIYSKWELMLIICNK